VVVFGSLCLAAMVSNVVIYQTGGLADPLVDTTSSLFGKSRSNIVGMTGRLELWTSIWESAQSQPWGFGFAAFERTFSLGNEALSWKAGNAHNGFISAWLGAGWLAFALLLALFGSMWARLSLIDSAQRPVYTGLLLLIMLNNLTVPAVGGRLTVVFLFLMALTHIPARQKVMGA
jgi:O-antigen ligase